MCKNGRRLTSVDFSLFLDVPGVKCGAFGGLHRCAFIEMLRQVRLIQTCDVHHLSLRNIVLLHVSFNSASNTPRVPSENNNASHIILCILYLYIFSYVFYRSNIMQICLINLNTTIK